MENEINKLNEIKEQSINRFDFWLLFIKEFNCNTVCEIGVYRGDFAEVILKSCLGILKYYMIDPWRNLDDWNKPTNTNNEQFNLFYEETVNKTKFAEERIIILRGKTNEVIDKLDNEALDFVYIDGDHTLKGITIDLLGAWNKVKPEGFIAGDDFCPSIWQHEENFEPTLVFPYALYFAEAQNTKIYALPFNQFLITKEQKGYEFIDLTNGRYKNKYLKDLIEQKPPKKVANSKSNILSQLKSKLKQKLQ